jgi:hypothetical protein
MEGSYKHIEYAVSNSRQWVILQVQLGGWPGANTRAPPPPPQHKKGGGEKGTHPGQRAGWG